MEEVSAEDDLTSWTASLHLIVKKPWCNNYIIIQPIVLNAPILVLHTYKKKNRTIKILDITENDKGVISEIG